MIREALDSLINDERHLSEDDAYAVMTEVMTGQVLPSQLGALLAAMRIRGESIDEIVGMARGMRDHALRVSCEGELLDTCGTGGDGSGTFNVSTAAAFVAAGAGLRVAKHGNRSMSSSCGSADVLEALGARIELGPEEVSACIVESGMGFMFAQTFHPAMKHAAPTRRELGVRTIFNVLGPLSNPAGARNQLVGVARPELVETLATVLGRLGSRRVMVVHGEGGLDELSLSGPTTIAELKDGALTAYQMTPQDAGLEPAPRAALRGSTPDENATMMRALFEGKPGPLRDFVLLNAGAALMVGGAAASIAEGVSVAARVIDSGEAGRALERFVLASNRTAATA